MSKVVYRKKFRKRADQPDRWPELERDMRISFSALLGYNLRIEVEENTSHEVSFLISLREGDYQKFCTLYDWYLTSHNMRL